ncbi:hypothetical protein WMO79_00930 [Micrococcaceae bacterium Sec7.4]
MTADAPALPRITADIKATLELDPNSWGDLPAFPAHLGTPEVRWGFETNDTLETDVVLVIDGEDQIVSFWSTELDGVRNTAEDTLDRLDRDVWQDLEPEDFKAAIAWGKDVHDRISDAVQSLAKAAAPYGSDTYKAVVAFATNTRVPGDERTPKEMSLFRAGEALAVTGGLTGAPQDDLQVLMCDLLHLADAAGLDLHRALNNANRTFQLERNDPTFASGL